MLATATAPTSLLVARLTHPTSVSTATTTASINTGIHTLAEMLFPSLPLSPDARRSTSLVGLADTNLGYRTAERVSQRSVRRQNGVRLGADENIPRSGRLFIVVS